MVPRLSPKTYRFYGATLAAVGAGDGLELGILDGSTSVNWLCLRAEGGS